MIGQLQTRDLTRLRYATNCCPDTRGQRIQYVRYFCSSPLDALVWTRLHNRIFPGWPPLNTSPRGSGEPYRQLSDQQLPLGIFPQADYRGHTLLAASGDLLIASTNGIFEVSGKDGVEFGTEGLERLILLHCHLPLAELAQKILATVRKIGAQDDDRTLLLIRII